MTKHTRRAALGAIGGIAAAGFISGHAAQATSNGDAAIEAAFQRRQVAYAEYNLLPLDNVPVLGGLTPREAELWDIIDEAEIAIRSATAKTPRGGMLQLWCAMSHFVDNCEDDKIVQRGDFAALDKLDSDLDWNARLMLAALRSLQAMEG